MTADRFEIYQGKNKLWYWRFRAKNGRITADTQGYKRCAGAERSIIRHILRVSTARIVQLDSK